MAPAEPTPWTPLAVWGSVLLGGIFLVGTYILNGGSAGRDYLPRYFALSAVVALWIAVPFQLALSLPRFFELLAGLEWYVPTIILFTNVAFFGFVSVQIHDVANRSRQHVR